MLGEDWGGSPLGGDPSASTTAVIDKPRRRYQPEDLPTAIGASEGHSIDFTRKPTRSKPWAMRFADRFEEGLLLIDPGMFRSIEKAVNKGALAATAKRLRDEQRMTEQQIDMLLDTFLADCRLHGTPHDKPAWKVFVNRLDYLHDKAQRSAPVNPPSGVSVVSTFRPLAVRVRTNA